MPVVFFIGALLFLAGVSYLVYHYEQARWIVAAVVLVIVSALAGWYLLGESEEQAELKRIAADEITLEATFTPTRPGGYTPRGYNRYTMAGRLLNDSQEYVLTEVGLRVRIEDCQETQAQEAADATPGESMRSCTVVSEGTASVEINVPPGQARDFVEHIQMPSFTPRGETQWGWDVEYIRAE